MPRLLPIVLLCFLCGVAGGAVGTIATRHFSGSTYFSDVSPASSHAEDIGWLHEYGVAQGYGDDTYRPALAVTRGQIATYLTRQSAQDLMAAWVIVDMTYHDGYWFGDRAMEEGRLTYEQYWANLDRYRWLWQMIEGQGAVRGFTIALQGESP